MKQTMSRTAALEVVMQEYDRAVAKHPKWPAKDYDALYIVLEEAGEAVRAMVQQRWEGGDEKAVLTEVIQTAAMCLRFLTREAPGGYHSE